MTLLAELARLLRLMDPLPPRVLSDAESAGHLLRPVHLVSNAAGHPPTDRIPGAEIADRPADSLPATEAAGQLLLPADSVSAGETAGDLRRSMGPMLDVEVAGQLPQPVNPVPTSEAAGDPMSAVEAAGPVRPGDLASAATAADRMPVDLVSDAELLVLLLDTVPAVRSAGRRLTFGRAGGEAVLDVEVRRVGSRLRVAGLAPVGAAVEVHFAERTEAAAAANGYFTVDVPDGPVRLLVIEPGGQRRCTGWF